MPITTEFYSDVIVKMATWSRDISQDITDASLDMGTSQVAELTISVDDPGYAIFGNSDIPLDTDVDYQNLALSIAVIETNAGGGEGGFTIRCRPRAVRALKARRGPFSVSRVSPSTYVQIECGAVGVPTIIQSSASRSLVARDVTVVGQQGNADSSAWSTFQRLADELGYLCFEVNGVIVFGQPSWLVTVMPVASVVWNLDDDSRAPTEHPTCTQSLDNNSRKTVELHVPAERANEFFPGFALDFSGIPKFEGRYFITSVGYPLVDSVDEVSVSAETPFDPEPQGESTL